MKIVVINLDNRKDRLQTFNTTNPNLTYERYSAVDGNKLSYQSYTATGELFDAFDLMKNKNGRNYYSCWTH